MTQVRRRPSARCRAPACAAEGLLGRERRAGRRRGAAHAARASPGDRRDLRRRRRLHRTACDLRAASRGGDACGMPEGVK